ncbi:MAG: hypothetical protein UV79_C0003G0031 [candidate division TM6 bacterium GW2011_GWF2_43_17]|nr:MAG: hypothetical protein UV79_C0003G0031 [candidate division TM6 bacterium GW2011_GWF2_43_17]HAU30430.1 hypothetical protein [Candidatus Dependentiae bacterium]
MKTLYTYMGVVLLGACAGLTASEQKGPAEGKGPQEKMAQTRERKGAMSKPNKILKDMVYETFVVEEGDKKVVGVFMRTKDGKDLIEKVRMYIDEGKTLDAIKTHKELKEALKEKFAAYLDKKGLKIVHK